MSQIIPEGRRVALFPVEKTCQVCGSKFSVKPSRAESAKSCSRECAGKLRSLSASVQRECRNCGKEYRAPASRQAHGRGSVCSKDCQYRLNSNLFRNDEAAILKECLCCGKSIRLPPSMITSRTGAGKYCSRACRDSHRVKENHPQFISGSSSFKRGPNWQAAKRAAKARDGYACASCGVTEAQCMERIGERLHVHHKTPYRKFRSFLEANQLCNLVTMCPSCHRAADAEIQRLEKLQQSEQAVPANDNARPGYEAATA